MHVIKVVFKSLLSLFAALLLLGVALYPFDIAFDNQYIERAERLLKDAKTKQIAINSEYHYQKQDDGSTIYELRYSYQQDGETHYGISDTNKLPDNFADVTLYFLPDEPGVSSLDPEFHLAKLKDDKPGEMYSTGFVGVLFVLLWLWACHSLFYWTIKKD